MPYHPEYPEDSWEDDGGAIIPETLETDDAIEN